MCVPQVSAEDEEAWVGSPLKKLHRGSARFHSDGGLGGAAGDGGGLASGGGGGRSPGYGYAAPVTRRPRSARASSGAVGIVPGRAARSARVPRAAGAFARAPPPVQQV